MVPLSTHELTVSDLAWLGDVREVRQPLSRLRPIWVRESLLRSGPPLPQPTVPHPERHPYCEFTVGLRGKGIQYVGREKLFTQPRSVMLLGPGIPHNGELHQYPGHSITVYFLPILMFDMGPQGDGAMLLNRFTAEQSIQKRIPSLPPVLWRRVRNDTLAMLKEFQQGGHGSELQLRSLLMGMLVAILRWEEATGRRSSREVDPLHWNEVQRALRYLKEHHADAVYVRDVARAAGVNESRLKVAFRESLGMSCVQYLKTYRISLAAAMLSESRVTVTEVAMAVGFGTLSHFNTTFRKLIGMSPTEYVASVQKLSGGAEKAGLVSPRRPGLGAARPRRQPVQPALAVSAAAIGSSGAAGLNRISSNRTMQRTRLPAM